MKKEIVFATCEEKPLGNDDDYLLQAELENRGFAVEFAVWSSAPDLKGYGACVLRSTWDYHRRLPEFLRWARATEDQTRLLNPFSTIKWNSNKNYLLELRSKGIAIVPTMATRSPDDAQRFVDGLHRENKFAIIKPAVSATADLTNKIGAGEEFRLVAEKILERGDLIIQPFVESVLRDGELSLIFFNSGDRVSYSHCVLKQAAQGDFRVQNEFGGKITPTDAPSTVIEFARQALLAANQWWLYARVDILDWKSKPLVSEIELIEPHLYMGWAQSAAAVFAEAVIGRLQ